MSSGDTHVAHGPIDPALSALALLYANGELEAHEAEAFEKRLADEQPVREALSQAVLLTQTLGGSEAPRPDPSYRDRVRAQLLPHTSSVEPALGRQRWWQTLLSPRVYRGHPMVWLLAGALAASLLVFVQAGKTPVLPPPRPVVVAPEPSSPPPPRQPAEPPRAAMAKVWAELHTSSHLEQVRAEETRRKHRLEERRLAHNEDRASRGTTH